MILIKHLRQLYQAFIIWHLYKAEGPVYRNMMSSPSQYQWDVGTLCFKDTWGKAGSVEFAHNAFERGEKLQIFNIMQIKTADLSADNEI